MALSTKNLPVAKKSISKTIKPGNVLAKINKISLEEDRLNEDRNGLFLVLSLEGIDLGEDFEGFFIDPSDETKGRYAGQVGNVKVGTVSTKGTLYSFADGIIGEKEIKRDDEILKFLLNLATELGLEKELGEVNAETIEEYVAEASKILSTDNFIYFTIMGREWLKNGFTQYNLFLARADYKNKKYSVAANDENLLKFDESIHIIKKKKAAEVESFGVDNGLPLTDDSTFSL